MDKTTFQLAKEKAALLFKFFTEKTEKFEAVKVADADTLLEISVFEVGAEVSVSTSAGSEVAPDGEYKLVNGAEFTIKDGKIETITKEADDKESEPEAKDDEAKEELAESNEQAPEAEAPKTEKSEDVTALETKVAKLEEVVAAMMEVINQLPSKQDVEQYNSNIEQLSKIPTQLSATVENRIEVKDSEEDKIKRIASLFYKNH